MIVGIVETLLIATIILALGLVSYNYIMPLIFDVSLEGHILVVRILKIIPIFSFNCNTVSEVSVVRSFPNAFFLNPFRTISLWNRFKRYVVLIRRHGGMVIVVTPQDAQDFGQRIKSEMGDNLRTIGTTARKKGWL